MKNEIKSNPSKKGGEAGRKQSEAGQKGSQNRRRDDEIEASHKGSESTRRT